MAQRERTERMLSVGVRGMVMPVAVLVPVIMAVSLKRDTIGLTSPRAFSLAELSLIHI